MKDEKDDVKLEELDVQLPSSILNETESEDDDSDMPLPETKEYGAPQQANQDAMLVPTVKFFELFNGCLGKLPYATILKNQNNDQIKLTDLFRYVESKTREGIMVKEMNTIISFIATAPFEYVRPLMDIIEDPKRQVELWILKENKQ